VKRTDLDVHVIPSTSWWLPVCPTAAAQDGRHILYVGVLAHLLSIGHAEVKKAIARQFGKKVKAAELNTNARCTRRVGEDEPAALALPARADEQDRGKIVIEGNQAGPRPRVRRAHLPGVVPITPSSSCASRRSTSSKSTAKESDEATYAVIQAEDEIA